MQTNNIQGEFFSHAVSMSIANKLLKHAQYCDALHKDQDNIQLIRSRHISGAELPPTVAKTASLTYLAFALEGYLQYIGHEESKPKISEWKKLSPEKQGQCEIKTFDIPLKEWDKLNVLKKLEKVAWAFGISLDMGQNPCQAIHRLIKFRDSQSHPKPLFVEKTVVGEDSEKIFGSLTLNKDLNIDDAEKYHFIVQNLVQKIEQSRPNGNLEIWTKLSESVTIVSK